MRLSTHRDGNIEREYLYNEYDFYEWVTPEYFNSALIYIIRGDDKYTQCIFNNIEDAIKFLDYMTVSEQYNPDLFEEKCYIVEVNPFSNNKYTLSFNGDECWYDEKGYMIRYKRSDGYEIHFNDGLVKYIIDKDGIEEYREYGDDNRLSHIKRSDGFEEWHEYDYDEFDGYLLKRKINGKIKLVRSHNIFDKIITEYDENENPIHIITGFRKKEEWYKYDENGRKIYYKIDMYDEDLELDESKSYEIYF
jgi:hypothetical protein